METASLGHVLNNFSTRSVAVLGDCMLDWYTLGSVERISPEAPVPILSKTGERAALGGAANVACNVRSLGGKAYLFGIVGKDEAGKKVRELLRASEVDCRGLVEGIGRPTTVKHRFLAGSHQLFRLDSESKETMALESQASLIELFEKTVDAVDIIIFSDYAKGFFSKNFTQSLITIAKKYHKKIIADIKPANASYFKGVDFITPNLKESLAISGAVTQEEAGKILQENFKATILVTLGDQGILVVNNEKNELVPARKIAVHDVTGAGDTVVATLALAISANLDVFQSAYLANLAAELVVQKPGTATVDLVELSSRLNERHIDTVKMVPKVWGYEKWIENNDKYCSKLLVINKGYQCSLHYHKIKDEMFLVTKGDVRVELGEEVLYLRPGNFIRVTPGTKHRFRGLEDSEMLEISTHHDEADSYRVEESCKVPDVEMKAAL